MAGILIQSCNNYNTTPVAIAVSLPVILSFMLLLLLLLSLLVAPPSSSCLGLDGFCGCCCCFILSTLRNFARRFWNHTYNERIIQTIHERFQQDNKCLFALIRTIIIVAAVAAFIISLIRTIFVDFCDFSFDFDCAFWLNKLQIIIR